MLNKRPANGCELWNIPQVLAGSGAASQLRSCSRACPASYHRAVKPSRQQMNGGDGKDQVVSSTGAIGATLFTASMPLSRLALDSYISLLPICSPLADLRIKKGLPLTVVFLS